MSTPDEKQPGTPGEPDVGSPTSPAEPEKRKREYKDFGHEETKATRALDLSN